MYVALGLCFSEGATTPSPHIRHTRKIKLRGRDTLHRNLSLCFYGLQGMLQDMRTFCIKEGLEAWKIDQMLGQFIFVLTYIANYLEHDYTLSGDLTLLRVSLAGKHK